MRKIQINLKWLNSYNPYRLIIVLSDGQDWPSIEENKHAELLDHKYCDKIRTEINKQTTASGYNVESKIAVIGIDYDAEQNPDLVSCAGADNVFTAKDMDDVYGLLKGLISQEEEIGHLYRRGS